MRSAFIYNIETIILTSYFILSDALITRSRVVPASLCQNIIQIYIYTLKLNLSYKNIYMFSLCVWRWRNTSCTLFYLSDVTPPATIC